MELVVNVAPDWESYSYTKFDVKDDAHDKGSPRLGFGGQGNEWGGKDWTAPWGVYCR